MEISSNPLSIIAIMAFLLMANADREVESVISSKRYVSMEDRHVFQETSKCDRKFSKRLGKVAMSSNCMPRPTIVDLMPTSPEILLYPSKVVVNRCSGECHAKSSCLPTSSKLMEVEVQNINVISDQYKCGIVNVKVHTRCHCACTVMEQHCNSKQQYLPTHCMCLCMNEDERKICESQGHGKFWNSNTCRCECHTRRECTTGLIWVPEQCRCAKLMPEDANIINDSF